MTGSLYEEVQHFYGRQMRHLDEGAVTEWAATFTEDGVFAANARPHPQEGRSAIEQGAREAAARLAAAGVQHRHWLGMLEVAEQPDGTVLAKTYALIIATPEGGSAAVHLSCRCEDQLVRVAGELKVRHRQVYRDDLPA
ncbi:nuclear transport factor 2 family protein [Kitasatospora aureofaciens]|uniref:nuclear transport factor 2 family protein n=1 Tax=Kitasatospora aureofaciens TaxID=1894 RepID=UPI001C48D038|nr:nuclear transport factor 2 family protein [Kitasatospora aureofaciens]MBV6695851.1 nuclear transport factor 2 family protein [Kitasatospora aureofaciens]